MQAMRNDVQICIEMFTKCCSYWGLSRGFVGSTAEQLQQLIVLLRHFFDDIAVLAMLFQV